VCLVLVGFPTSPKKRGGERRVCKEWKEESVYEVRSQGGKSN
jgi:hypothetical protein